MRCDEGYPCEVCGEDVEQMNDSDLYLRFVLGLVDPESLHTAPERHLRCNPTLSQFIVDAEFPPVVVEGEFDKRQLDPEYVAQRESRVTEAWRRLRELPGGPETSILDYRLE